MEKEAKKEFTYPAVVYVEAVLMENGEVISHGKTLGFTSEKQMDMVESGASKLTKGGEPIIGLGDNIA